MSEEAIGEVEFLELVADRAGGLDRVVEGVAPPLEYLGTEIRNLLLTDDRFGQSDVAPDAELLLDGIDLQCTRAISRPGSRPE